MEVAAPAVRLGAQLTCAEAQPEEIAIAPDEARLFERAPPLVDRMTVSRTCDDKDA